MKRLVRVVVRIVIAVPLLIMFIVMLLVNLFSIFSEWLFEDRKPFYTAKMLQEDYIYVYIMYWKTFLK